MKNLLLGVALTLAATAHAEYSVKKFDAQCDTTENIFGYLKKEFNEEPYWVGALDPESKATSMVTMNWKTKTWTFVVFNPDTACILVDGKGTLFQAPLGPGT